MENNKRKLLIGIISIIGVLILTIGATYAFFNYTRTGAANNVTTGRIAFNTSQDGTIELANLFPIATSDIANANLDTVTVTITGDTTYSDGEEFLISLVDVENTVGNKRVPVNYIATYEANTGGTIGTSSNDYFNARESKDASIYQLNTTGSIVEGKQVLVGYIDNGATGINGTLTIKAYIDKDKIAISDTYNGQETDNMGTTNNWVDGRTVLTTTEWNSLSSNPISFKIRSESNEGIWVEEPGKILSCPDCKFMYVADTEMYTTWNIAGWDEITDEDVPLTPTVLTSGLYDNYENLISATNKNYFLGVKLNNNNEVTNAYACAVKDNVPFCIEGTDDNSKYVSNQTILQGADLFNNTCELFLDSNTEYGYDYIACSSQSNSLIAVAFSTGFAYTGINSNVGCNVYGDGSFECTES